MSNEYLIFIKHTWSEFIIHKPVGLSGHAPKEGRPTVDLLYFTLFFCGDTIGWTSSKFKTKNREFFIKYLAPEKDFRSIRSHDLKPNDEFLKDLADHSNLFSLQTLKDVFKIANILEQRLKTTETTLEEAVGL